MLEVKDDLSIIGSKEWINEPRFYYLNHKELIGDNLVIVDLANICVRILQMYVEKIVKDEGIKNDIDKYVNFAVDTVNIFELGLVNFSDKIVQDSASKGCKQLNKLINSSEYFKNEYNKKAILNTANLTTTMPILLDVSGMFLSSKTKKNKMMDPQNDKLTKSRKKDLMTIFRHNVDFA